MKIEFITDSNIKDNIIRNGKNKLKVTSSSQKIKNSNNYLIYFEAEGNSLICAKVLSDVREKLKSKFELDKTKYYLLTDEPTIKFLKKLYPQVCEFETKLRKLLYIAFFDLEKPAEKLVLDKFKGVSVFKKNKEIPKSNFLENSTLGELFYFLFENGDFLQKANQSINEELSKRFKNASKADIISLIEKNRRNNHLGKLILQKSRRFYSNRSL